MQADRTKFDQLIETSAGSLGHGFPMAVGMAWAKKIKDEDGRIFCLAGDGEMNEGTMWEAVIFAASEHLDNLILIIDDNRSIGRMIDMGSLPEKLQAFGFTVSEVDGHDTEALKSALKEKQDKPYAVLAKTVRGWGSKTLMEDRSWFHRYPKGDELEMLCREVDEF
jgi:transketolase